MSSVLTARPACLSEVAVERAGDGQSPTWSLPELLQVLDFGDERRHAGAALNDSSMFTFDGHALDDQRAKIDGVGRRQRGMLLVRESRKDIQLLISRQPLRI